MSTPLTWVYQDEFIGIVLKPAGLPSQRTRAGEAGLYEQLCEQHPYVGLHHRLDRNASGLLVVTLDRRANRALGAALKAHQIERFYTGVAEGDVLEGSWTWPVEKKSARTDVLPLRSAGGLTEFQATLHTGRTHQIRIHAAMNGTPLVGDRRYGGDLSRPWIRVALHAHRLKLQHPITGVSLDLSVPLPEEWPL